ncbi:hypothetical protein BJY01DRAFT_248655 [Aspergillus pseudoustus]|uniref:Uncharacterized protein n=1 Tax=Aspergillus pseudoustus TaxID=1810923 RepID=A0ABR4JTJ8_9EURO
MQKLYIPAPNCEYPPGAAIAIGRILSDPFDIESCLNNEDPLDFSANVQKHSHKSANWKYANPHSHSGLVGLWAKFLEFVGLTATANFSWSSSDDNVYDFREMLAEFVDPTPDFIKRSMSHSRVKEYIEMSEFRKPIYIITGVRIATGATVAMSRARERKGQFRAGADGKSSGVPASGGPEARYDMQRREELSFTSESSFVFAYRLRKVYYRKEKLKNKKFPGQLSSQEGSKLNPEQNSEAVEYTPVAYGSASESETMKPLKVKSQDIIDDQDEARCVFVTRPVMEATS